MIQYTHTDMDGIFGNAAFTLPDGRQFPRVWWRTASEQEIAGLGFVEYEPPEQEPQPDPVPYVISRRQIMTGLALAGWITEQEALDAIATGARPAAVELVITALPEDQQFHARMKWAGFQEAYRTDPLVIALADAEGKSPADIDEFFRMCAEIK